MSLDIHVYFHYPPDKTVVEKLDVITELVKALGDDPKIIAALADRVAAADQKLEKTVEENKP